MNVFYNSTPEGGHHDLVEADMNLFSLEGRVALVTGASRGIGRGIAEGLGSYGARVICAARTRSQLDEVVAQIEGAGGEALAVEMDLADLRSVTGGVDSTLARCGQIDILVNNAGINIREPVDEVTEDHYDQIFNVNLKGLYFLTQAVVRQMIPRKSGKIVNIGSLTTDYVFPELSVYASTKGAIGQLTKVQALEYARHNIQVNAICPGFVLTPLTERVWSDPKMQEWGANRIPLGRLAAPEDMVGTAVFLASAASDYLTGQCVFVDGGMGAGEAWPLPEGGGN
jgi:gluconate 5-dehydrogenase/2-deoxy-D-gluconate 3-dehydrogenase